MAFVQSFLKNYDHLCCYSTLGYVGHVLGGPHKFSSGSLKTDILTVCCIRVYTVNMRIVCGHCGGFL